MRLLLAAAAAILLFASPAFAEDAVTECAALVGLPDAPGAAGNEIDHIDLVAARDVCRAAVEVAPDDPPTLYRLAVVLGQFGHTTQTLRLLEDAADAGFSPALARLSWYLVSPDIQLPNFNRALLMARRAGLDDNPLGQFVLGFLSEQQQDAATAYDWYLLAAEQGYASAQARIGAYLEFGWAGAADPEAALDWYRKAAENGDRTAQGALARLQANGDRARETELLLAMLRDAADTVDHGAEARLGEMYGYGIGVPVDLEAAERWLNRAIDHGYPMAALTLAQILWQCACIDPADDANASKAVAYATIAADAEVSGGYRLLAEYYQMGIIVPQDYAVANANYEKANALGNGWATYVLAINHRDGNGFAEDPDLAFEYFAEAAERGVAQAQYQLGVSYLWGYGAVEADAVEAEWWLTHAAYGGLPESMLALGQLYEAQDLGLADPMQARAWYEAAASYGNFDAYFRLYDLALADNDFARAEELMQYARTNDVGGQSETAQMLLDNLDLLRWAEAHDIGKPVSPHSAGR